MVYSFKYSFNWHQHAWLLLHKILTFCISHVRHMLHLNNRTITTKSGLSKHNDVILQFWPFRLTFELYNLQSLTSLSFFTDKEYEQFRANIGIWSLQLQSSDRGFYCWFICFQVVVLKELFVLNYHSLMKFDLLTPHPGAGHYVTLMDGKVIV